jgi:hypothetical protein
MNRPDALSEIIESGSRHLDGASDGNLPRGIREVIWDCLGPWKSTRGWRRRARLAIASATVVQDVWAKQHPDDDFVQRALASADRMIRDQPPDDPEEMAHEIGAAFNEIPGMDAALPAAWAATKAIYAAAFDETFDSDDLDWDRPDRSDLRKNDAAFFAAWAYSGSHPSGGSDADARREFWRWWLKEAVPAVAADGEPEVLAPKP